MGLTIEQAFEMIERGETTEQYEKRLKRVRRLANERDALTDAIEVLQEDPRYTEKVNKSRARLMKVNALLEELR